MWVLIIFIFGEELYIAADWQVSSYIGSGYFEVVVYLFVSLVCLSI